MNLAVIPARGGSKRIPRKNIRDFCGQPIIDYSIRAARQAGVFDRIIVSTNCDEIASVARACGADVPFKRPASLSDDFTPTMPVVAHAIDWFSAQQVEFDYVCCIYATAPFLDSEELKQGFLHLASHPRAEFLLPVTSFAFPIFRALQIENENVSMFWPENEQARSQDLPEAYHDAGQFYWGRSSAWSKAKGIYSAQTIPLVIPPHRVQDIDTPADWTRAEMLFEIMNAKGISHA
jgi:N-acylneuraminate cytidylyltransferase